MDFYQILTIIGVPSLITLFVQWLVNIFSKKNRNHKSEIKSLKLGIQALLRDRLLESYKIYRKRGWISIQDKENFNNMYCQYHSLGQNGVMDGVYKEVMDLPTDPPITKYRNKN